ncbi:H(2)-dependent methylenetetrahydromethanopterin dehydrogenase-related protein [Methanocaldococcus villosus KIN24-T80]|uniref:H(2)-dependent methylenetetrahydromethanopterin dehydrogenase-related protein n=1 Tax=Methanocaldococcus villosus KIN24-T80 TaxID=1069083 RepID=N6VS10_9EURY|nr:H(2)-dependent methylenetetrahydromethanopterin dehydrogenase-related protein [Methanocaldococcus villosus]ENN96665.1 H(2)-dependent methylenetetrahydromethanopterin dehydrogenase-related protein [Methanocaldococcus villosus KIN24-T80]
MKISVYGAGNQRLYIDKLKLHKKFNGKPPYGGAKIAMEFAEVGHDVILSEPNRNVMKEELWKCVKDVGVKVVNDDIEAAKHGEVHILFTPFGNHTIKIAEKIVRNVPKDAIICTTCTLSPLVLYYSLEKILKFERRDVGISSMHPASVPGTELHKHYVISGKTLDGKELCREEQINKLVELCKSVNKKPYLIPAGVSSALADMGSLVTAVALAGILDYYTVGRKIINAPKKMIEHQVMMSLYVLASIVETSGIDGLLKAIDLDLLINSASSMKLIDDQKDLLSALEILKNLKNDILEESKNAELKETCFVASQSLVKEIKSLIGGAAAEGAIKRSTIKLFKQ